jgi:hypothetical protein
VNIGDAHSERLISTHHKILFYFISVVVVNVSRFSIMDRYVLFSLILSVCFRTDYRNCPFEFRTRPFVFGRTIGIVRLSLTLIGLFSDGLS